MRLKYIIFLLCVMQTNDLRVQTIINGCKAAEFGIDGDIYSGGSQFGNITGNPNDSDDWFTDGTIYSGNGLGVIDVQGSQMWETYLLNGYNYNMAGAMSLPPNSIVGNIRWQDAIYSRDYYGGAGATDTTSYTQASKNGEDPAEWDTGASNVTPKNDLIDCYGHLRRDGITTNGNLWLNVGFSRISNSGSSYFDAELYANNLNYDTASESFNSAGPDEGHVAWEFDAQGNITKHGDLVLSCMFSTNAQPELNLRIWVSRFDYQNTTPATFIYGGPFDGGFNGSEFGYAEIKVPSGANIGCGLSNMLSTNAPPWGTLNSSGDYSNMYDQFQFVEIGVDLTTFGVDPALAAENGIDPCWNPFANILFKSRASNSFTAQLKDFSGPFPFGDIPIVPPDAVGGTITCLESQAEVYAEQLVAGAYYWWETPDGNIVSDSDSAHIFVDMPGMYILHAAAMSGCEEGLDTTYVYSEIMNLNAWITADTVYDCAVVTLLEGHSSGMGSQFSWNGPDGFSSALQNISVFDPGTYYLEVFDVNSGCAAYDTILVSREACETINPDDLPDNGNLAALLDTIPPDFTLPADITINCDQTPDVSITGDVLDESDNCANPVGEATYTDNETIVCDGELVIERTWFLMDGCGNETAMVQTITLSDTVPPTFTVPADITLDCNDNPIDLILTGDVTDENDNCDNMLSEAVYTDEVEIPCMGSQIITRIWMLADDCGNTVRDTQIITLQDVTAPDFTIPPNITVECDADLTDFSVTGTVNDAYDNCDLSVSEVLYVDNISTTGSFCDGTAPVLRTWGVEDGCGNINVGIQFIYLEDNTPPDFNPPADITLSCETDLSDLTITGEISGGSDNCDTSLGEASYSDIFDTSCGAAGMVIREWALADACGNTTTRIQNIYLEDNSIPTFTPPPNVTISCEQNANDLSLTGTITDAGDACTVGLETPTYIDVFVPTCSGAGVITRTWSLSDACGNTTTGLQTITIEDNGDPTFTVPFDITLNCHLDFEDLELVGDVYDADDVCDIGLLDITYTDVVSNGTPCNGLFITRIWAVTDDCGNVTTANQVITIIDTYWPEFQGMPVVPTISCDSIVVPVLGVDLIVTDNCDTSLTMTYTENIINNVCPDTYILERVWTATDDCGNQTIFRDEVYVEDIGAPVAIQFPGDITISCADSIPNADILIADNCDPMVDIAYLDTVIIQPGGCAYNYTIERNWEWVDNCGNVQNYIQEIEVLDEEDPHFDAPADITVSCDTDVSDLDLTGGIFNISDNCDTALATPEHQDRAIEGFPCDGSALLRRLWTLVDECGNVYNGSQLITLADITPPTFTPPADLTLSCHANPDDLNLTGELTEVSDACDVDVSVPIYSDSLVINCEGHVTIFRAWYVTDDCGNDTVYIQNIELLDNEPPSFTAPADITLDCQDDFLDLGLTGDVVDETDSCDSFLGEATFVDNVQQDVPCSDAILVERTWSLADDCGNVNTQVQQITLIDDTPPEFLMPEDITIDCSLDPNDLTLVGDISTGTDNCDTSFGQGAHVDSLVMDFPCAGSSRIVRTWSLSDACGNENTSRQYIVLMDNIAPIFTVPADITIECDQDPGDLTLVGDVTDESDSCDGNVGEATFTDMTDTNLLCDGEQVITRTWMLSDACGNTLTLPQVITLQDTQAPTFNTPPDITISCLEDPLDLDLTGTTNGEADNCDMGLPTLSYTDVISENDPCPGATTITRTWELSDDCGNIHTDVQQISLEDLAPPIFPNPLADITVDCDSIPDPLDIETEDICGVVADLSFVDDRTDGVCTNYYEIIRTWTVTDACGNTQTTAQQIMVQNCGAVVTLNTPDEGEVCEGEDISISVTVGPEYTNPLFQWQFSADSVIWSNIFGGVLPDYDINGVVTANTGYYRVVVYENSSQVNNDLCTIITEHYYLTVLEVPPLYTWDAYICDGDTLTVGNDQYTSPGIYSNVIETVNGCDSLVRIRLRLHPVYETPNPQAICLGDTLFIAYNEYTTPGTYVDTLTSQLGCDSVVITELDILYPVEDTIDMAICEGDSLFLEMAWQTTDGIYVDTFVNFQGCDSILVTELVVNTPVQTDLTQVICEGESVVVGTSVYTLSGNYSDTLVTMNQCDSVVNLALTVNPIYFEEQFPEICQGESFEVGSNSYSESGTYVDTLLTIGNCDSIIQTELLVKLPVQTDLTEVICEGESVVVGTSVYTLAGNYTDTLTGFNQCDSILATELIVKPTANSSEDYFICNGDSVLIDGVWYFTPQVLTTTFIAANGCDSILTQNIIPSISTGSAREEVICEGDSILIGGNFESATGIYEEHYTASDGCDSIVLVSLGLTPSSVIFQYEALCEGDSVFVAGAYQTETGIYTDTLGATNGCDSIVITELLFDLTTGYQEFAFCDGDSLFVGGDWQTTSGIYYDTLSFADACDSIVASSIVFYNTLITDQNFTICASDSVLVNGTYYSEAGVYVDTLSTAFSCDSIVVSEVEIAPLIPVNAQLRICEGDSILVGTQLQSEAGIYTDTLQNANGCDTVLVTELIVVSPTNYSRTVELCEGETFFVAGADQGMAGTYYDTLANAAGCDSIIISEIIVHPVVETIIEQNVCEGESVLIAGNQESTAGVYPDTLQTTHGCDSIVITNLIVRPVYEFMDTLSICQGDSILIHESYQNTPGSYPLYLNSIYNCDSNYITELIILPNENTFLSVEICQGDSLFVGGAWQQNSGVYTDEYMAFNACDSTVFTELLVVDGFSTVNDYTICTGDSLFLAGAWQTTSGIYRDTLISTNGCDSIVVENLDVVATLQSEDHRVICQGETILIDGFVITAPGIYTDSLTSANGCDSVVLITLDVIPVSYTEENISICEGESIVINNISQQDAGIYLDTLAGYQGCDSIIAYELHLIPPTRDTIYQQLCDGETIFAGGATQSVSGTYVDSYIGLNGCDSVVTTILEVFSVFTETIRMDICAGEGIFISGNYTIEPGVYVDSLQTAAGCDSLVILELYVNPNFLVTLEEFVCEGDSTLVFGNYESEPGNYYDTLMTQNACDSIIEIQLQYNTPIVENTQMQICSGDSILIHGQYESVAGIYTDSLTGFNNCDSISLAELVVVSNFRDTFYHEVCQGDGIFAAGSFQTVSGTYEDNYTTASGCDSMVVNVLDVISFVNGEDLAEICEGEEITIGNTLHSMPGIYADTLMSTFGCDSIVMVELVLHPIYEVMDTMSMCVRDGIIFNGEYINTSGTYYDTLQTVYGCDSILITVIDIFNSYKQYISVDICQGDSVLINGVFETDVGNYTDSLTSIAGCDSILYISLDVITNFDENEMLEICEGDSILIHGQYENTAGSYSQTYTSSGGCDSNVTVELLLLPNYLVADTVEICAGDFYTINDIPRGEAGNYTYSLTANSGCDSTISVELIVWPEYTMQDTIYICPGDSVLIAGSYRFQTGTYNEPLLSEHGCDSLVSVLLQFYPEFYYVEPYTFCESSSITIEGTTYDEPGLYENIYTSVYGCDSVVVYNLQTVDAFEVYGQEEICAGDSILINGAYVYGYGVFVDSLLSNVGCDSLIITEVSVVEQVTEVENFVLCEGDSLLIGGDYIFEVGLYIDTIFDAGTCERHVYNYVDLNYNAESLTTAEICVGEVYTFAGSDFNATGIYPIVFPAANGCDSIATLELTVKPHEDALLDEDICFGQSYGLAGEIYTETGVYTQTLLAYNGCDSIVTLDLYVAPEIRTETQAFICAGESYEWEGITYFYPGVYERMFTAASGCDSNVMLTLEISMFSMSYENYAICPGDSIFLQGAFQTEPGTYFDTIPDMMGCDSMVTSILDLSSITTESLEYNICEGEEIVVHGNTYSEAGVYMETVPDPVACDTLFYIIIEIQDFVTSYEEYNICIGDTVMVSNSIYTMPGIYTDTLVSSNSCDSILISEINTNHSVTTFVDTTVCFGEGMWVNGTYETTAGIYVAEIANPFDCDSTVYYHLFIDSPITEIVEMELCTGGTYDFNGEILTEAGVYSDTLTASNGCDSFVLVMLEMLLPDEEFIFETICSGDSILLGNSYLTETGIYEDTLATNSGCDSIVILDLTVVPESVISLDEIICEGESITVGNSVYTETGFYVDTLSSYQNCDSIVQLQLAVVPSIFVEIDTSLCFGESIIFGNETYDETGEYTINFVAGNNCDSTIYLNLNITPEIEINISETICYGEGYVLGETTYTQSGFYTETLITSEGCDSIVNLNLTVLSKNKSNEAFQICVGDSIYLEGAYQYESGIFMDTLTASNGCDSLVVTNLEVLDVLEINLEEVICQGDSIFISDAWRDEPGVFVDSLITNIGCDSIVTTTLLVEAFVELFVEGGEICAGDEFQLFAEGATEVTWFPEDRSLSCTNCPDPIATPAETTIYTVTAESCLDEIVSAEVEVFVYPQPEIELTTEEVMVQGDTVLLIVTTNDVASIVSIYHESGELLCTGCYEIAVNPMQTTSYYATAVSMEGCEVRDEVVLNVSTECVFKEIQAPNFITPNGDGANDEFEIRYRGVSEISSLRIFNRWGELVFETTDIDGKRWDGTFRGTLVNPGVYVYYLEGLCLNFEQFFEKGNITVIR